MPIIAPRTERDIDVTEPNPQIRRIYTDVDTIEIPASGGYTIAYVDETTGRRMHRESGREDRAVVVAGSTDCFGNDPSFRLRAETGSSLANGKWRCVEGKAGEMFAGEYDGDARHLTLKCEVADRGDQALEYYLLDRAHEWCDREMLEDIARERDANIIPTAKRIARDSISVVGDTVFHKTSLDKAIRILSCGEFYGHGDYVCTSFEHIPLSDLWGGAGKTGEITIEFKVPEGACPVPFAFLDPQISEEGDPECEVLYDGLIPLYMQEILREKYPGCNMLGIDAFRTNLMRRDYSLVEEKEVRVMRQGGVMFEPDDIVAIHSEARETGTTRDIVISRLTNRVLKRLYGEKVVEH